MEISELFYDTRKPVERNEKSYTDEILLDKQISQDFLQECMYMWSYGTSILT